MTEYTTENDLLFENVRQGDLKATQILLQRIEPDLRRYARKSCASADVDEAVQDAMLIIYRKAGALKFLVAMSSWLFKIVLRICLRLQKKNGNTESLNEEEHLERENLSPAETVMLQQALTKMLMKIDAHYREILLLRDFLGYTNEETASRLNISLESAKSRLHRARALARKELSDDFR